MVDRREFLIGNAAALALPLIARGGSPGAEFIQTVRGPLQPAKLGFTLTHEHLCNCSPEFLGKWSDMFGGRAGLIAKIVARLREVRRSGVDTLVDLTPYDVGRDIRLIEQVSRESGMNIIACTGQHLFAPAALAERSVEEFTRLFIEEIQQGIDGTGIKAGVIKVVTDREGITPRIRNVLVAAARASKQTGAPIQTHTHARLRMGEEQAAIFESEGVSPDRVSLGHSDDSGDAEYLLGLARRGYTLGMDHVNRGLAPDAEVPWRQRAENIKLLIDAGFVDRIFLSTDSVLGATFLPPEAQGDREKHNPDGMRFISRQLLPHLRASGVTAAQLRAITIGNPRRFYALRRPG